MKFGDLPHGNSALAVYPSREGFGWIVFDGPLAPVDWGVSTVAKGTRGPDEKNKRSLAQIERLIVQYRPAAIVLEAFEGEGTKRHPRITRLHRSVIALAATLGIRCRVISRHQIEACFASRRASTREEVAAIVAKYLREIGWKLPGKRKIWNSEDPRMALFQAAALLIVHYANPQEPL